MVPWLVEARDHMSAIKYMHLQMVRIYCQTV